MQPSVGNISRPRVTTPVIAVTSGEDVYVAVEYKARTWGSAGEIADDVGHVRLRGNDLGGNALGTDVGNQDVGCGEGVAGRVGGGCLSEALEEGDVGGLIGFDCFEKGAGVHDEVEGAIEEMRM
jgi:hypothetical protein